VAASIFRGWLQRISAQIAAAQAEHLDRHFYPISGVVARQAYAGFAARGGGVGTRSVDDGLLGVTGHVRNQEPRWLSGDIVENII
jgi:hypothetical protein